MYLDNTPHELVNLKSLKQGGFAEMFIMNWVSSFFYKYDCDLVCTYILVIFTTFTISDTNLLAYWAFPQALFTVELEIGLQIEALEREISKSKKQEMR